MARGIRDCLLEQITKNKLYIYTREKNTGFDRRFLMKRVGESWRIDAVQERLTAGHALDCEVSDGLGI